jgi:hypothetical protein
LLIHLYAVIAFADGAVRATECTRGIFTVVTGDGAVLRARVKDRNTGMEMALAQDMLLIIMRHYAGNFAGVAPNTLLAVSHNKTIHNDTCFWFNNLILCMNMVFTHHSVVRQCSIARNAKLFPVNLWQINFIQEAVL